MRWIRGSGGAEANTLARNCEHRMIACHDRLAHSDLMRILFFLLILALPAHSTTIERACLKADRPEASRSLCRCTQTAADRTLSERDQRLAATFFKDPDRAQEIRQSDRRRDEAFWERYKTFRDIAVLYCRTAAIS